MQEMKKEKKSDLPGPYTNSLLFLHQARTSGKFSSEELSNLKREFQHHKDKIHEYNILMDTVSRTEGEPRSSGLDCGTEVNEPVVSTFRLHTRQDVLYDSLISFRSINAILCPGRLECVVNIPIQ